MIPDDRAQNSVQDSLTESSVRPNPTLFLSKIRSQFSPRNLNYFFRGFVRAGAREANRQDGRELNRQGECAGGESSGRAGA